MAPSKRSGFGIVEGYTERPNARKDNPSTEALPEAAKVSTPGERAEFITRRLKEAAQAETWVTAPQLAEEWLQRSGELNASSKVKARIRKTIGEWLRKECNKGLLDQLKGWIDHPPTDGWRYGLRWDRSMHQVLESE